MPIVDVERELREEIEELSDEQRQWFADFVNFFDKQVAPFGMEASEKIAFLKNKGGSLFFPFNEQTTVSFAEAHFVPARRNVFVNVCRGFAHKQDKGSLENSPGTVCKKLKRSHPHLYNQDFNSKLCDVVGQLLADAGTNVESLMLLKYQVGTKVKSLMNRLAEEASMRASGANPALLQDSEIREHFPEHSTKYITSYALERIRSQKNYLQSGRPMKLSLQTQKRRKMQGKPIDNEHCRFWKITSSSSNRGKTPVVEYTTFWESQVDFEALSVEDLKDLLETFLNVQRVSDDPDKRWKLEFQGLASDSSSSSGNTKPRLRYLLSKDDQRSSRTLNRLFSKLESLFDLLVGIGCINILDSDLRKGGEWLNKGGWVQKPRQAALVGQFFSKGQNEEGERFTEKSFKCPFRMHPFLEPSQAQKANLLSKICTFEEYLGLDEERVSEALNDRPLLLKLCDTISQKFFGCRAGERYQERKAIATKGQATRAEKRKRQLQMEGRSCDDNVSNAYTESDTASPDAQRRRLSDAHSDDDD